MKVIQAHNHYRMRGGECAVFEATTDLLRRRGLEVLSFTRDSGQIGPTVSERVHAFASGIYSFSSGKDMTTLIRQERPDVLHAHNLYPLISPSVLVACQRAGIPVVMTVHNYRFACPIGSHQHNDRICELCVEGREFFCFLRNCRHNMLESLAYSLRSAIVRKLHLIRSNVTVFIAITEFAKRNLIKAGYDKSQIMVVPQTAQIPESFPDPRYGKYAAYVGRLTREKGVHTLLAAAKAAPGVAVQIAGDSSAASDLVVNAPKNVKFVGWLDKPDLANLYAQSRFVVVPSEWYEVFPVVLVEAMGNGLPVIASRIGALPDIVEDGVTGLLFEPGDSEELAAKMRLLWEAPDLCQKMGQAAREKAIRCYSEENYYAGLLSAYEKAISMNKSL